MVDQRSSMLARRALLGDSEAAVALFESPRRPQRRWRPAAALAAVTALAGAVWLGMGAVEQARDVAAGRAGPAPSAAVPTTTNPTTSNPTTTNPTTTNPTTTNPTTTNPTTTTPADGTGDEGGPATLTPTSGSANAPLGAVPAVVDMSDGRAILVLTNPSDREIAWSAAVAAPGVAITPRSGTATPNSVVSVELSAVDDQAGAGELVLLAEGISWTVPIEAGPAPTTSTVTSVPASTSTTDQIADQRRPRIELPSISLPEISIPAIG